MNLCECGCGEGCKNRFVNGHNRRGKKQSNHQRETVSLMMLNNNPTKDPKVREKIRQAHLGKTLSEEHKLKLRDLHLGDKNHFYGKKHSLGSRQKMSASLKGRKMSDEAKENMRASAKRGDDNPSRRLDVKAKISTKMKGRTFSDITRKKMSERAKGRKPSEETKAKIQATRLYGDDNPARRPEIRKLISEKNKGREVSEQTRVNMSIVSLLRFQDKTKHPRWKGGASKDPYCSVWKNKEYKRDLMERDGFECKNPDCWNTTERLTLHHIDYDKENCHPSNLITICGSCNARANSNRDYWREIYSSIDGIKEDGAAVICG